jgi:hypothetical protein
MLTAILPNQLATADLSRFLLNCQQIFMRVRQRKRETASTLFEWNAENSSEPENYVGALYGFINQKVKRDS